jgi:hypothetical protein
MRKKRLPMIIHDLSKAPRALKAICTILILAGCCLGKTGCGVTGSGWQAHRYGLFDMVWASIDSTLPDQVQKLDNTWKNVLNNGYVTTDSTGQGEIKKNTCHAYIFQSGSGLMKKEYLSACPKGAVCTISLKNCSGITVVTLPAKITFKGTYVTIIVDNSRETVIVMSSEGIATVTPKEKSYPSFDVGPGYGAYAVTSAKRGEAGLFFGFAPGELRDLGQFIVPIENLGQIQQVQSANLIATSQRLPIIPIPAPNSVNLTLLNGKYDDSRVLEAIVRGVNIYPILDRDFLGIPFYFTAQGERTNLRSLGYDPELSNQLFQQAGVKHGTEMILAYDESIPGLSSLAAFIADEMNKTGAIIVKLQGVNLKDNENPLAGLEESGLPVLFMGGG